MARLIFDTSVLVDAERKGAGQLENFLTDGDDVAIAAITAAELYVGVELASGRRQTRRAEFLDALLAVVPVESYELDVAEAHGALLAYSRRAGRPRGAHDLIIAATARARQREVVTGDVDGFVDLPEVAVRREA